MHACARSGGVSPREDSSRNERCAARTRTGSARISAAGVRSQGCFRGLFWWFRALLVVQGSFAGGTVGSDLPHLSGELVSTPERLVVYIPRP